MMVKLKKKIERLAGMHPRRECPFCGHKKLERVSRSCNMCGRELGRTKGEKEGMKQAPHERDGNPRGENEKQIN